MKIRNLLLLAIFTLILSYTNIYSQTKAGIYGGTTFSDMSTTPTLSTTNKNGIIVGGNLEFATKSPLYIVPGIQYISKGTEFVFNTGATTTTKLDYLEIPVKLRFKFPMSGFRAFVEAGPTLGFLMSATQEYVDPFTVQSRDVKSAFESNDFGVNMGVGGEYAMSNKMDLWLSANYQLGLTNVSKDPTEEIKNVGFQLMTGVKFDF